MEMDIPASEDLGWLEADLDLHDDYLDEDLELPLHEEEAYIEEVYEHPQSEPIIKPDLSTPDDHRVGSETEISHPKKRLVNLSLLDPSNVDESVEDKRCKIDSSVNEAEDDWMRYSPPPKEPVVVVEEVEEERYISRYATDIEGDFMPVTAPDGDRVYAKLIKEEKDDKLKRLEVKGLSKGLMSEPISVLMQKVEQDELQKLSINAEQRKVF
ncbi:hypothetical protein L1987_60819 [Smallanthus sonchifolius]|uniref:Uncharacterized protein n=1 Tax=Smallanthus sonchifolius TaxID=185202 RepID=A0ACB9D9B7_9ASTR|nr:hypothetical protein L1987_60819 [Smallanthus sonchifolius]